MHDQPLAAVPNSIRDVTLSARFTRAELLLVEAAASDAGMARSAWTRQTLLAGTRAHKDTPQPDPSLTIILEEIVLLRVFLTNALAATSPGLSPATIQFILDYAERTKKGDAAERLLGRVGSSEDRNVDQPNANIAES